MCATKYRVQRQNRHAILATLRLLLQKRNERSTGMIRGNVIACYLPGNRRVRVWGHTIFFNKWLVETNRKESTISKRKNEEKEK